MDSPGDKSPDDLMRLEEELVADRPKPSLDLRNRVMCSVQRELVHSRTRNRWAFAAAVAAMVLVLLNLSLGAATTVDFSDQMVTTSDIETRASAILEIVPELSRKEARRQALLMGAGDRLVMLPKLPPPSMISRQRLSE